MADIEVEESTELVKRYYIDYAKYVLETRALPSIYDGLKFAQRRLVYVGSKSGLKFEKSSKILGNTIPYHPHGLDSLYGVLVNLTTNTNRYKLFEGKGNWGGIGFDAAAYRYTEAYLNEIARFTYTQFVDSADFVEGESGLNEPKYLPALIPYSLITGAQGIGVGLSTSIMPLDILELIDYYISTIKNEKPKIPTPDLGNYILDMDDKAIDKAVEGHSGTLSIKSVVTTESDTTVVLDDLFNHNVYTVVHKMDDWINAGIVDFRDETTTSPRYVFEIVDTKKLTVKELANRITSLTKAKKTFTRLVVDDKVAVYSSLKYQVEKSLEYLNKVLDKRFSTEIDRLQFQEQVLLAINAIRSEGIIKEIPSLTVNQLKSKVKALGFTDDVINSAVSKSMTYLTKSHDNELKEVRKKIKSLRETDRTEYLIYLYELLRDLIKPIYDSSKHTVRKSNLLTVHKFKLENGVIHISNRGTKYNNTIYAIHRDGYGTQYHVGASTKRDVTLKEYGSPVVKLLSDFNKYIVFITNKNRALVADITRLDDKIIIKLDDGEFISQVLGSNDKSFKYKNKVYDGEKFYKVRLAAPVALR